MLALIVRLEYVGIMFQAIDKVYLMHIQGYKMSFLSKCFTLLAC